MMYKLLKFQGFYARGFCGGRVRELKTIRFFRSFGALNRPRSLPWACALGFILAPLRGFVRTWPSRSSAYFHK